MIGNKKKYFPNKHAYKELFLFAIRSLNIREIAMETSKLLLQGEDLWYLHPFMEKSFNPMLKL
jgi:NADPH-dependent 7-cyano-7-deazaguanine reductase QueF-like protein